MMEKLKLFHLQKIVTDTANDDEEFKKAKEIANRVLDHISQPDEELNNYCFLKKTKIKIAALIIAALGLIDALELFE